MLHGSLKRIGATELRVYDNKADSPVDHDSQSNEESGAGDKAGVADCVGLPNDASASALY